MVGQALDWESGDLASLLTCCVPESLPFPFCFGAGTVSPCIYSPQHKGALITAFGCYHEYKSVEIRVETEANLSLE